MSGETVFTIIGNLTADPELRFTPAGAAVANFTIASTPRTFDRDSNQWKDGDTLFMRCSLWREAAENMVESLKKGDRVIAEGWLKTRKYTPKEGGDERTVTEMEVQELGASVKYAKLGGISKADTSGRQPQQGQQQAYQQQAAQGQQQGWGGQQAPAQGGYQQQPAQGQQATNWSQPAAQQAVAQQQDPWAAPAQQPQQWGNQPQQGEPNF